MRLYHVGPSRSTRVLWTLEEIGEPYDLTLLKGEDRKTDEHRLRHPLGRVPVMEDDEGFLFESAALCLHLADLHPDAQLNWPPGTHERALVYQWTFFAMTELEPPLGEIRKYREDKPELAAAATERFRTAAAVVDQALDGHEFLVGDRFSVADIVCGAVLGLAQMTGVTEGFANIEASNARLQARPARERANAVGR